MKSTLLAALCTLCPAVALAQTAQTAPPPAPAPGAPTGLVVSVDVGGGGIAGGGTEYTPSGVFEGEVGAGYEVGLGLRPELSLALGLAPTTNVAIRPGLHYDMPDLPFYLRGALDWSTIDGGNWRWLIAGGGGAVQLNDVLGAFGEFDLGVPLRHQLGVGVLVRAGISFRL